MDLNLRADPSATETSQPSASSTAAEFRAVQAIENDTQFVGAVAGLLVSFMRGRGGFVFAGKAGTAPQCIANRMGAGLGPRVLYSPEIRETVEKVLASGAAQRSHVAVEGGDAFIFICTPARGKDQAGLAVGALLGPERADSIRECEVLLGLISELFDRRTRAVEHAHVRTGFERTKVLLELFHEAGQAEEYEKALSILAEEIRRFVGCHYVAFGFGSVQRMKVAAVSGGGNHDHRGQTASLISRALSESLGVESEIAWPPGSGFPDSVLPAGNQVELMRAISCDAMVALPLKPDDDHDAVGAWMCGWKGKATAFRHKWELIEALTPHLSVVAELIRASKPRGLRGKVEQAWKKSGIGKKLLWIGLPLVFAGAMVWPVPHRVAADCLLQPSVTRHIAAPFDAVLERPMVKPGEVVEENQLLARLEEQDLGWQLADSVTKRDAKIKLRDEALAKDEVLSAQLADLEVESLALEIEVLEWRQKNLEIFSPVDGLVLSGDLEQSEGVPVSKGQKLFEIAPVDDLKAEISVPDSDSPFVEAGMTVVIRLGAYTDEEFSTEIVEVYPIAEIQDGENVFVCYARLANADALLRPGMRGKARIEAGTKPLGWILFRKPINFLRLQLW
ncbi:MAG: hypothetical protein CMO55_28665 [Verrucomicrobiales bacterium]|nr:hypothetical protein [Verrucomicrobiales bacterium]